MLAGGNCVVCREWEIDGVWAAQGRAVAGQLSVRLPEQKHVVT